MESSYSPRSLFSRFVLWCCRRRSEDSTRSVDSMMVRLLVRPDGISTLSSEGSGETAPVQVMGRQGQGGTSMRLSGGSGGTQRQGLTTFEWLP